ncbi:T9SS type A sorting domain-containing protein [Hymenobacter yonginensis]|uniref:T9SS type A sorting domain-containing protein n=1 Tax=Hymenobacter yonginensis TaxID=748197 RepID=UPI0038CC1D17
MAGRSSRPSGKCLAHGAARAGTAGHPYRRVAVWAGSACSSAEFELQALPAQTATSVFPNPTRGPVTVRWTQADFSVHAVELINAVGRRVLQRSASLAEADELQLELELSGVRAGFYMIILHTSQGKVFKRLSVL